MATSFKTNDRLNDLIVEGCTDGKRKSLKEAADVWYNKDPDKVKEMIKVMIDMNLMQGVPDGYIFGSNSVSPSTGTFLFYKTEAEIEQLINDAEVAKPKGWATGVVLEKMAGVRIVMFHKVAKSVNEQLKFHKNHSNRPPIPPPDIHTIQAFQDYYDQIENSRGVVGGGWEYYRKMQEIPEFLKNPNLTDEHISLGMGHASAAIVSGE